MGRTTTKGIRLTPAELHRAARLRDFFPEVGEEAELHKLVFLRGLLLLEAEVAGAGGGTPPGISEAELGTIVLPRILAVLQLLGRLGKIPPLLGAGDWSPPSLEQRLDAPLEQVDGAIDATAAQDIERIGSDFL